MITGRYRANVAGEQNLGRDTPIWEQWFDLLVVPIAISYGLLSGIRWPNLWSATHLLFDYKFGFIKRGLFGETLRVFAEPPFSYAFLAFTSFMVFAVWMALLLWTARRAVGGNRIVLLSLALMFASPGYVFLVHEIGYFDHVGMVVAIGSLLLPPSLLGLVARAAGISAAILIHEVFFLLFFPVVVFDTWLSSTVANGRWPMLQAGFLAGLGAILTWFVGDLTIQIPESEVLTYLQGKAADFTIRATAVQVLIRDGSDNLSIMADFWASPLYPIKIVRELCATLPLVIFFLFLAIARVPHRKWQFAAGAVAASLAPLMLHGLAWDMTRFNTLIQITAFLTLLSVLVRIGPPVFTDETSRMLMHAIALLAILSAAADLPLFDGYSMQKPPFTDLGNNLIDILRGTKQIVVIPPR